MSKNYGLPIPFIESILKLHRQNTDSGWTALSGKMDSILTEAVEEVLELYSLKVPERIPASLLEELGDYVAAGLKPWDSDTIRRKKIEAAVRGHKRRGSWTDDAKPKIDAISGGDSQIVRSFDKDDWILCGDGTEPPAYYWAALGCDGVDFGLGISLIGAGTEMEVAGNIYIDLGPKMIRAPNLIQNPEDLTKWPDSYLVTVTLDGYFTEYAEPCQFSRVDCGITGWIWQPLTGITVVNPSFQAVLHKGSAITQSMLGVYDKTATIWRTRLNVDWTAKTVVIAGGSGSDLQTTWYDDETVWVSVRVTSLVIGNNNELQYYPENGPAGWGMITAIKMENGPSTDYFQIEIYDADKIQRIVEVLRDDITPAYMYVHLGYISAGVFIEYVMF